MGPIWGRQDPGGPHVDPMNFAIWVYLWSIKRELPFPFTTAQIEEIVGWISIKHQSDTFTSDRCLILGHPGVFATWWCNQMEIFSALLALCVGNHRWPVDSPHKVRWHGDLMFSFMCAWTNGWANSPDAGDFRGHWAHYDVTVINLRRNICLHICRFHSFKFRP